MYFPLILIISLERGTLYALKAGIRHIPEPVPSSSQSLFDHANLLFLAAFPPKPSIHFLFTHLRLCLPSRLLPPLMSETNFRTRTELQAKL
jgi:hypothetical protein